MNAKTSNRKFNYDEAFVRNLGWVTPEELNKLKNSKIAIGGMGGVGGSHLIALVRLGVQNFHIADLDDFEIVNFNRQVGANMKTIGKSKVETLAQMARDINPDIQIKVFDQGIQEHNIDEFLEGVDLYIDSLDFFVLDLREVLFAKLWDKKIPAINVGPMGMSSAMINFIPKEGNMTFEEYFGLSKAKTQLEKNCRFALGIAPALIHRKHIADPSRVNLEKRLVPSTPMGISIATSVCATEAMKILLGRGKVLSAPHTVQIDAYSHKIKKCWRPFGYKNPITFLKLIYVRWLINKMIKATESRWLNEGKTATL